jgi:hypothetical protein
MLHLILFFFNWSWSSSTVWSWSSSTVKQVFARLQIGY